MRKGYLVIVLLCVVLLSGCRESDIVKTYQQSEKNGIINTYYELNDNTWKCKDQVYQYRLELSGRLPNAAEDMSYIVLTNNDKLTFDEVAKSMYSSSLEDSKVVEQSVVVEMK